MGDTPHKPLLKIRTFQLDQAHARGEEVVPVSAATSTVKEAPLPPAPKVTVTVQEKKITPPEQPKKVPAMASPAPTPPSFHELKKSSPKKIEHIVAMDSPAPLKTVTVREKASPAQPARVLSSQASLRVPSKKSEFNFFAEVVKSFKAWLQSLKAENNTPTYTVSALERRKGVIQKATTSSGATFTSDTSSIKNEITKKREETPTHTVPDTHVTWSPNTEPGFTLLEEPPQKLALQAKSSVVVEYKKKTLPAPVLVEPVLQADVQPKRVFVPPVEPTPSGWESATTVPDSPYTPSSFTPPTIPAPVFKVPERLQRPATPPVQPQPQPVPTPPAPVPSTSIPVNFTRPGTSIPNKPNPKSSYLRRGLKELFRFDTTVATVVVVGSMVSFFMVFLIVKTFIGIITPTDSPVVELSSASPLTPKGTVTDIAISSNSLDALKSALLSEAVPSNGVAEFRVLDANSKPLTGPHLWRIFNFTSNPSLSGSISEVHIGSSNGDRMLVLTVTDAVTVFGSLLSWEKEMAKEVLPVFNQASAETTSVTDETVGNSDVRILKNDSDTILVYGFINKNTVVITESLEAYKATLQSE